MSQWRAQQAENTILQIQAEDDQDFSNEDVINQFEENYEEDVFPHEQRRKFFLFAYKIYANSPKYLCKT